MVWGLNKLLLVLLFSLMMIACSSQKDKAGSGIKVNYVTVQHQTIPLFKDYIGTTKAISTVNIRARVSGFLVARHFTEGDKVKKGELLYVIDKRPFIASVDQQKALLEQRMAALVFQEKELIRMKKLIKKAVISQEQYDSTLAQEEEAVANVASAKAQLETAKLNLSYCSMYAPIDGKIGQTQVNVGNYVSDASTSNTLATIVTLDPIYVLFYPSDNDYGYIRQYMNKDHPLQVKVTIPGDQKNAFHGTLDFVNNEVNKDTSTITLRATVKNENNDLLAGLHVNVRVFLSTNPNAIIIPQQAILETQGNNYVYVIGENNIAETKLVTIGGVYQDQQIIKSGLSLGDKVVINRLQILKPGRKLIPQATAGLSEEAETKNKK